MPLDEAMHNNNSKIISSMQENKQTNRERMIKDVFLLYKGPAQFNEKI